MKELIYRKGDVFLADLGIPHGSEQGGRRPVVIIQNDDGCVYSPTVTMVPMTTAIKKPFQKSHYILRYSDCIRYRSMVEAEQIQTIDKDRIIRRIGHLDPRDISGIEEAMRNHFLIVSRPRKHDDEGKEGMLRWRRMRNCFAIPCSWLICIRCSLQS